MAKKPQYRKLPRPVKPVSPSTTEERVHKHYIRILPGDRSVVELPPYMILHAAASCSSTASGWGRQTLLSLNRHGWKPTGAS